MGDPLLPAVLHDGGSSRISTGKGRRLGVDPTGYSSGTLIHGSCQNGGIRDLVSDRFSVISVYYRLGCWACLWVFLPVPSRPGLANPVHGPLCVDHAGIPAYPRATLPAGLRGVQLGHLGGGRYAVVLRGWLGGWHDLCGDPGSFVPVSLRGNATRHPLSEFGGSIGGRRDPVLLPHRGGREYPCNTDPCTGGRKPVGGACLGRVNGVSVLP